MTENNAAQPGLTDEEILDAIKAGIRAARDEGLAYAGPDNYVVAGAHALLSKLRAEGVQAGDVAPLGQIKKVTDRARMLVSHARGLVHVHIKGNDASHAQHCFDDATRWLFEDLKELEKLASAPVAEQEFKAAFPNGVLTSARFHELWERAGKTRNGNYTLLENLTWQVGQFGDLVAQASSAPVVDERDRHATISAVFSRCALIPGATFWNAAEFMYDEMHRRAALASAPVHKAAPVDTSSGHSAAPQASEAVRWVVTDDMRAAVRFAPSSAHWSERLKEFFGPDAREGINALEKQLREARADLDRQKHASEAVRSAALLEKLEAWQAVCDRIVDQYGGVVAGVDFAALGRANRAAIENAAVRDWTAILPQPHTDMRYHGEFVRGWNQCLQQVHAALSAQPRAQKHPRTDGGGRETVSNPRV